MDGSGPAWEAISWKPLWPSKMSQFRETVTYTHLHKREISPVPRGCWWSKTLWNLYTHTRNEFTIPPFREGLWLSPAKLGRLGSTARLGRWKCECESVWMGRWVDECIESRFKSRRNQAWSNYHCSGLGTSVLRVTQSTEIWSCLYHYPYQLNPPKWVLIILSSKLFYFHQI